MAFPRTLHESSEAFLRMSTWYATDHATHSDIRSNTTTISRTIDLLYDITTVLWCLGPPVLLVFGTFGNVMIVVVMRGMRASQSMACLSVYFTALAVSDQCLLLVSSVWFWVDEVFSWPPSFFHFDLLCTAPIFVFYTFALTSAWFLVAMTYQRVTSVVAPHRVGVLCTVRRGKVVVATIVVIAFVLNVHVVFTFTYQREERQCVPDEKHSEFVYFFTWLDLFWASVIPFVLLLLGNSVLILQVIKSFAFSRHMREGQKQETASGSNKVYPMTVTLILTSAVFLALTLPICVFHTYTRALDSGPHSDQFRALLNLGWTVTHMLWSSASASNFYLYLLSGRKFREETKKYFKG